MDYNMSKTGLLTYNITVCKQDYDSSSPSVVTNDTIHLEQPISSTDIEKLISKDATDTLKVYEQKNITKTNDIFFLKPTDSNRNFYCNVTTSLV